MQIIRESGLLIQSSPTALIMGDKGYRGKLGIVVPASKKAKVSREVQQLEDKKQRGHNSSDRGVGRHLALGAVLRLRHASCVCIDQCYPAHSSSASSRASQR